jgi:hypothetical protein
MIINNKLQLPYHSSGSSQVENGVLYYQTSIGIAHTTISILFVHIGRKIHFSIVTPQ